MKIGFVGPRSEAVLAALRAEFANDEVVWFDPDEYERGSFFTWDAEGYLLGADDVSGLDAVVVRKLPGDHVPLGAAPLPTPAQHDAAQLAAVERRQLVDAWLADCERRGTPVYNPVASRPFDAKPRQLQQLHALGCPLPRTLVTNVPDAVRAFAAEVGEVIYKPVAGGREAALLDQDALSRLDHLGARPVIFQERIVGPDVRVTVVGGRIVSEVEIPSHPVDYRLGEAYARGAQVYAPVRLPDEVRALCVRVADACHQALSGIDLKRAPNGRYLLLEANSAPMYRDIEVKTGHPISATFAELIRSRRLRFDGEASTPSRDEGVVKA